MNEIEFISCDGDYSLRPGVLNRWNISTGEINATITENSSILCVCSSNDGTKYASCSYNLTARVYNRRTNRCIFILEGHSDTVVSICFSHDDIYILTCSDDHTFRVWLTETGKCIKEFGHAGEVLCGKFSLDNKQIVTASGDESVRLWNIESGECIKIFKNLDDYDFLNVCFSPVNEQIAFGCEDFTCRIFDAELEIEIQLLLHDDDVDSICFLPDGKRIVTSSFETIYLWEIEEGDQLMKFEGHSWGEINSIDISLDGSCMLSGGPDKTIRLWDIESGKCLHVYIGLEKAVRWVCFLRKCEYGLYTKSASKGLKRTLSNLNSSIDSINNSIDNLSDEDEKNKIVYDFLEKVGINESLQSFYGEILIENNFTTLEKLRTLNESKLKDIGIDKKIHIDLIVEYLNQKY